MVKCWWFFYSVCREVFTIDTILGLLFDIAGEVIGFFIPNPKTKFEKHIERLKEEEWFSSLLADYRYSYIIYENRKVRRFLSSERNLKMIISMDAEKENFIRLVKEEHAKFTRLY